MLIKTMNEKEVVGEDKTQIDKQLASADRDCWPSVIGDFHFASYTMESVAYSSNHTVQTAVSCHSVPIEL